MQVCYNSHINQYGSNSQSIFKKGFEKINENLPYANRAYGIIQNFLKGSLVWNHKATKWIRDHQSTVVKTLTILRLLSFFNLISLLSALPKLFQRAMKELVKDRSRMERSLSGLACIVNISEMIGHLGNLSNALLILASQSPIELFVKMTNPIGIFLGSMNSISRVLLIVKINNVYKKFSGICEQSKKAPIRDKTLAFEEIKKFLTDMKITDFSDVALERNKARLLKQLPKEIAREFQALIKLLGADQPEAAEIGKQLNKITHQFHKNINAETGNLVANLIGIIGITLFSLPVAPFMPFLFFLVRELMRLSLMRYVN